MNTLQIKTEYCLNCKNKPCQSGCPLGNNIPKFISLAKEQKYKEAYEVLKNTTVMPFICGRICPKSKQCQGKCIRGIKQEPVSIGDIECAIGDMATKNGWYQIKDCIEPNGKKVAIVGSGPAGITASIFLAKKGFDVTIFEKRERIGGILRYGIPDFRLDKKFVDIIEEYLHKLGIHIKTNKEVNNIKELLEEYNDVIISCGANKPAKMGIPGEELPNVYGGNELLEYGIHPNYSEKKVLVIGGGNVAIDVARTIKRLGAEEVTIAYRRAKEQMPAEPREIEEAIEDKVNFMYQVNIQKIREKNVDLIRTELVKKQEDTRLVPVDIPGSEFSKDIDYVVIAIGSKPNNAKFGLELNEKGFIKISDKNETSMHHVYACGDCIGETATVAWASRSGRNVAEKIM